MQEIFAVQAVPGVLFPEIIHEGELLLNSYALPDKALKEVAQPAPPPPLPTSDYGSPETVTTATEATQ